MISLSAPLVALDLETTGPQVKVDRIVQVAVIKVREDLSETEWSTLIDPEMPIPRESTEVHHITDEVVRGKPAFRDVASILSRGLSGCYICAYNGDFDLRFLASEFRRVNVPLPTWLALVDPFAVFQMMHPRTLEAAVRHYLGEELKGAHDALVDARAALRVLMAQLERHPELPQDLPSLITALERRDSSRVDAKGKLAWRHGEVVINFGDKWAGTPLRQVDRSYLEWILRSDFPEDVRRIVAMALRGQYLKREEVSGE